jgi:hypothetical protein
MKSWSAERCLKMKYCDLVYNCALAWPQLTSATGLAFASCNDGTIAVAHQDSPDKYSVVRTITTQRGARTMALDTKGHIVYTVTAEFEPPPPATPQNPHLAEGNFEGLHFVDLGPVRATVEASGCGSE